MKGKLRSSRYQRVVLLMILLISETCFAQFSLKYGIAEAGFTLSPSNLLGDLGGNPGRGGMLLKDNNLSNTKLLLGAHLSVFPAEYYALRIAANYGTIAGDDALIKGRGGEEESRIARNLNFKSRILELLLAAEFYPTVFLESDPTIHYHKLRPYIVAGLGAFHFNPLGYDATSKQWVSLKELHTEGQGFPELPERKNYNKKQVNIPVGLGIKYFLNETVSISTEVLLRKTFTDYLDDVSTTYIDKDLFYKNLPVQKAIVAVRMYDKSVSSANRNSGEIRGKSSNMDSYYSAGIKLSFQLARKSLKYMSCPRY